MKKILILLLIQMAAFTSNAFADQMIFQGKIAPEIRVKFTAFYRPTIKIPGICGELKPVRRPGSGWYFDGSKQEYFKVKYDQDGNYTATLNTKRAGGGICGWEFTGSGTVEFHSATGTPTHTLNGWNTRNIESSNPLLARCFFGSMYVSCSFDNHRYWDLKVLLNEVNTMDFIFTK